MARKTNSLQDMIKRAEKLQKSQGAEAIADGERFSLEEMLASQLQRDAAETAPTKKRTKKVTLMCWQNELDQIRRNANEMGLTMSDYIRQASVHNCLAERRANDIRDASLDLLAQLRCTLGPMLPVLQDIMARMPPGEEREQLAIVARGIVKALGRIDRREDDLCAG